MRKAMIMPIVFSAIFVCVIILYSLVFFILDFPMIVKILILAIILGIASVMMYLLHQRNKELEEEEKDDISKY
ncbi:MAG: hypothetical protein EOM67_09165 [Spirochaetia bacterium]|nr:hypothetical protein [Spirochaetia bacterium]